MSVVTFIVFTDQSDDGYFVIVEILDLFLEFLTHDVCTLCKF